MSCTPCRPQKRLTRPRSQVPRVQTLATEVKKGGVEVLAAVPLSEETEFKVELFVKPVIGNTTAAQDGREPTPHYWSISSAIHDKESGSSIKVEETPDADTTVCYSLAEIAPPDIPNQVSECDMKVWELYRMETELLVVPLVNALGNTNGVVHGLAGTQLYFWAVGGQPLDVVGVTPTDKYKGPTTYTINPPGDPRTLHVYNSNTPKAKVTSERYSVESWAPDPSRNDNCRYFGRVVGGAATPPVVSYGNNSTIPLLDENGIGILCLHGRLYITCADMLGTANSRIHTPMARFFRLHFRQRRVKNPFTMNVLYKQVFNRPTETVDAQVGVTEVTMVEEIGPLPPSIQTTLPTSVNLTQLPRTVTLQSQAPLLNTQQNSK
uniref:Major capsid protein VP1 n=1 Tax=Betapolyomavirus tertihominis TaxID=1891764 RepID=A6YGP6_9POLY|nr:VP1 [Betapolyomavirus tertihominis]AIN39530.1 VP1 [Betapolyomavirus tertihominis]QCQ73650.1 VP1 [Betapolyomavirus tertihominis]WIV69149.1 VP1 [Betapolyomavirus tertihominis]WIV69154.1 VP1 [Betapolyomavirus tertihominis]